ncbi:hypothetical protein CATYP_00740 [Corynebacterium atypicum]|uniref:Uncharacterized protein n=1 Tax=Corynebacterium atypicum TaxID=191610 RepID=A0ABM5QL10_9CORY|nr:hypothetical protein CATYP_00740 [Corynebacterium atypicum]
MDEDTEMTGLWFGSCRRLAGEESAAAPVGLSVVLFAPSDPAADDAGDCASGEDVEELQPLRKLSASAENSAMITTTMDRAPADREKSDCDTSPPNRDL